MYVNGVLMNINDSDLLYLLMFNDNMNRQLLYLDLVFRTDRIFDILCEFGIFCM